MKDEIKDLKCLSALGNLQSFAIDGTKGSKIVDINVNIVKRHITNLQEENKFAKEYEKQYRIAKSRNEKAIEFNQIVLNSDYVYSQDEIAQKNLNILEGDKDE